MMVVTYSVYIVLSVALTIWVAQTLFKNGRIFLVDVFKGNEGLADSVNHLLVVGFYLINLGYVCLALKVSQPVFTASESIEEEIVRKPAAARVALISRAAPAPVSGRTCSPA